MNDRSKGSGESLRISTVWTTRSGTYYTTGDPGGAGAEDWWADVSTSTHILEVQANNATANRAEIVIETNASKGNSSVGFGGSGPAFTPAALALCISDTWPRNTLVRNRPFNVGIRANIPGFINSPHRP